MGVERSGDAGGGPRKGSRSCCVARRCRGCGCPPVSRARRRSLQCHLRAGENLERELLGKLPPKELQALLAATHRPNFCKQARATRRCRRDACPAWPAVPASCRETCPGPLHGSDGRLHTSPGVLPPAAAVQVLAEVLRRARLPGDLPANTSSTANVKASAFVRMDEHLTVFAVGTPPACLSP